MIKLLLGLGVTYLLYKFIASMSAHVQGKTILIIGDSLSAGQYTPGWFTAKLLETKGMNSKINAKVGRSAQALWANEQDSLQRLALQKFDFVLIFLGTNDMMGDQTKNLQAQGFIRNLFSSNGSTVYGITPPAFQDAGKDNKAQRYRSLQEALYGNRLLDAYSASEDMQNDAFRTPDGIHFNAKGASRLGIRLASRFIQEN